MASCTYLDELEGVAPGAQTSRPRIAFNLLTTLVDFRHEWTMLVRHVAPSAGRGG